MMRKSTLRIVFLGRKKEPMASLPSSENSLEEEDAKLAVLTRFFSWCVDNSYSPLAILQACYPKDGKWNQAFQQKMHEKLAKLTHAPWDEIREAELMLDLDKYQYHELYDHLMKLMKQSTIDMVDLLCE